MSGIKAICTAPAAGAGFPRRRSHPPERWSHRGCRVRDHPVMQPLPPTRPKSAGRKRFFNACRVISNPVTSSPRIRASARRACGLHKAVRSAADRGNRRRTPACRPTLSRKCAGDIPSAQGRSCFGINSDADLSAPWEEGRKFQIGGRVVGGVAAQNQQGSTCPAFISSDRARMASRAIRPETCPGVVTVRPVFWIH